jgi:hypothetical protein
MTYAGPAQGFYPEPNHDDWRRLQEEARQIIEVTRAFDDPNVPNVPNASTSLSEQTERSKPKRPRHLPRLGRNQVVLPQTRIKFTISRDKKEVELPNLSFTKDDLGASVDKISQADRISLDGSALAQDQQKYPIPTFREAAMDTADLFPGVIHGDESGIVVRQSDESYYDDRDGSSNDSYYQRQYDRRPRRRARDYSPPESGSYTSVHYRRLPRRSGSPRNPNTAPVVLPMATPNPPIPRLRTRRSLPELMSNSLGTEVSNKFSLNWSNCWSYEHSCWNESGY